MVLTNCFSMLLLSLLVASNVALKVNPYQSSWKVSIAKWYSNRFVIANWDKFLSLGIEPRISGLLDHRAEPEWENQLPIISKKLTCCTMNVLKNILP